MTTWWIAILIANMWVMTSFLSRSISGKLSCICAALMWVCVAIIFKWIL